jgi:chromate transporter
MLGCANTPPALPARFLHRRPNKNMPAPTPAVPPAPHPDRQQPRSLLDLFLSFSILALQGFGGVLAVVQHELVERKRWLTREEFLEEWAVAQILPGPNVVNLSLTLGARYFGLRGAMVALAGMLTFPTIVVLTMAIVYARYAAHPGVAGALRGMGAVAAGLIIAAGLKLVTALNRHPLGKPASLVIAALCFAAVALWHLPLVWVLGILGTLSCVLTWQRIAP